MSCHGRRGILAATERRSCGESEVQFDNVEILPGRPIISFLQYQISPPGRTPTWIDLIQSELVRLHSMWFLGQGIAVDMLRSRLSALDMRLPAPLWGGPATAKAVPFPLGFPDLPDCETLAIRIFWIMWLVFSWLAGQGSPDFIKVICSSSSLFLPSICQLHQCNACHAKRRWMSPSATPATWNEGVTSAMPVTGEVPRLPCETKVDVTSGYVTKCRVCQAKCRGVTGNQSAPPEPAQCPKDHACHAKRRWMSPRSTSATWNEGGCHQVPRLPRKVPLSPATNQSRPSALSALSATQNEGGCRQVPRLPRATKVSHPDMSPPSATSARQSAAASPATNPAPTAAPEPAQCPKCHACHAKQRWMSPRAMPAMWNEGGCHPATQSAAASPATNPAKRATRANQVS